MRYSLKHLLCAALAAVVTIVAVPALAGVVRNFVVVTTSTSPFTGTAPSSTACDLSSTAAVNTTGMRLSECKAYYVCVYAASAQTLSGAGSVAAYYYDEALSAWTRASLSDETVPAAASGNRYYCFPQRALDPGTPGCLFPVPTAITTSGGTTVTTTARCIK